MVMCRTSTCDRDSFEEGWCRKHYLERACHERDPNRDPIESANSSAAMAVCRHCGEEYDTDMDQLSKCPVNLRKSLEKAGVIKYGSVPLLK